jgi:hypothetical protein
MKTLHASLATCAVLSFSASAGAASLVSIKGAVQINSGSGFHQVAQVAGSAELAPGNSVMVAAGASAEIRYSDDCRIPVRPGSVEVVARFSPCRPPPTATAVQGGTLVGADPDTFVRSQLSCATIEIPSTESPPVDPVAAPARPGSLPASDLLICAFGEMPKQVIMLDGRQLSLHTARVCRTGYEHRKVITT